MIHEWKSCFNIRCTICCPGTQDTSNNCYDLQFINCKESSTQSLRSVICFGVLREVVNKIRFVLECT